MIVDSSLTLKKDYNLLMKTAEKNQQEHNLPESFFASSSLLCQASAEGLVPLDANDEEARPYASNNDSDLYARGQFSQEEWIAEGTRNSSSDHRADHSSLEIQHSSDLYQHCKSHFQYCCAVAENVDGVEALVRESIAELITDVKSLAIAEKSKPIDFDAPIVSSHIPMNHHTKCVRKKHPSEPQRKRIKGAKLKPNLQDSFMI
jgi:hypothetical protein